MHVLICASCCGVMAEALDAHLATIPADELAEAEELTSEEEWEAARENEVGWSLFPDGRLVEADEDERSPRAWPGPGQR